LSNTVQYRTLSGGQVTTISRAIYLLGFDTVKDCALAMMLVERLCNAKHSHAVRTELVKALFASVIGREIARNSKQPGAEEAAIAALFANIGQVLVAAYDFPGYAEIAALVDSGAMTQEKAAMEILGCSFNLIAQSVLRDWKIPESIVQAMTPLRGGALKLTKRTQERVQQIASFSVEASDLLAPKTEAASIAAKNALISRFGSALNMTSDKLDELIDSVETETRMLAKIMGLSATGTEEPVVVDQAEESGIPDEFLMYPAHAESEPTEDRYPSGKPINARERLLAGVQEIMVMTAGGRGQANDLMLHMLETLYNSMGFRFATICLKDARTGDYRSRIALGEKAARRKAGLVFSVTRPKDIFKLSMDSDADLMVSDAADVKIRDLLPDWHREFFPDAGSFIVLPIIVQKNALGFFYADRSRPAPEGVPSDETALIKILKSQVLAALSNK
jgi:HD-like signal output (HDOD) protein